MEMGGLTEEQVDAIVEQADALAQEAEIREAEEKRAKKAAAAVAAEECSAGRGCQESFAKPPVRQRLPKQAPDSADSEVQPESAADDSVFT